MADPTQRETSTVTFEQATVAEQPGKRSYARPQILSREPLEALAAACNTKDGIINPTCSPPIQS